MIFTQFGKFSFNERAVTTSDSAVNFLNMSLKYPRFNLFATLQMTLSKPSSIKKKLAASEGEKKSLSTIPKATNDTSLMFIP